MKVRAFSFFIVCFLLPAALNAADELQVARRAAADAFVAAIRAAEKEKGLAGTPLPAEETRKLHAQGIAMLQKRDFEASEKAYAEIVAADPYDSLALYNMACLYSLWGKADKALECLERSVRAGYADLDHMEEDSDLDPIRGTDAYKAVVSAGGGARIAGSLHEALAVARTSDAIAVLLAGETIRGIDRARLASAGGEYAFFADDKVAAPIEIDGCAVAVSPDWDVFAIERVEAGPEGLRRALIALSSARPLPPAEISKIPAAAREYVAKKHFADAAPDSPAIDAAVEVLCMPKEMLREICAEKWVARQVRTFASDKFFFLLHVPGKGSRVILFRGDKCRKDQEIPGERVAVLRRLYNPAAVSAPRSPLLGAAEKALEGADPAESLDKAVAAISGAAAYPLDEETLKRAAGNFGLSAGGGRELAIALEALASTEYGPECVWAAIWLISRMDAMAFHRQGGQGGREDLQAVTARVFFENVYYAVKARNVFPWGRDVVAKDFLQHTLSPRGTSEPLQRWRRIYFEALEPALRGMTSSDRTKALAFATACCYDFFQYEGATTWEDFGMLTALAVHEGRCEDCSNVENSMLRAAGLPACQAFTPYWANGDGNHAWTVVPLIDDAAHGSGKGAAKVFLKTWDGLEDITGRNTQVVDVELASKAEGAKAALMVFNQGDWRLIARAVVKEGRASFRDVGKSKEFVFMVRIAGEADRLVRVTRKGAVFELRNDSASGEEGIDFEPEKSGPLGEFRPDADYSVQIHEAGGFRKIESKRLSTGALGFRASPDRLYRLVGPGVTARPFTVSTDPDTGDPVVALH